MLRNSVLRTILRESVSAESVIEDVAKDGGEEFFTEMHCVL